MCLDTITKRYDPPDPTEREAYKQFEVLGDGTLFTPYQGTLVERDCWLKAIPEKVYTQPWSKKSTSEPYPTGFHVYATLQDAENARRLYPKKNWLLKKVIVRGVRFEGTDGTDDTIEWLDCNIMNLVADEMYVPSQPGQDKEPR